MTKKELQNLIDEFMGTLDDYSSDDWYDTERGIASYTFDKFLGFLKDRKKHKRAN